MMSGMQVLIIGASGFIGRHLFHYCKRNGISVAGTYYKNKISDEYIYFDINNQGFSDLMKKVAEKMDCRELRVILCSADTDMDSCKMNEKSSYVLNVQNTKKLLYEIRQSGIKTAFLSSEAVFDGEKGMYSEKDETNPVTVYGKQKREVENYIVKTMKDALIFRISRAVGSSFGEADIFDDFYKKIRDGRKILCLRNQSFCVTEVDDIASAIILALDKDLQGIYNISSKNYVSRYELALLYAEKVFQGNAGTLEVEYSEMGFMDNRHIKGGLDGTKLNNVLHLEYKDLDTIMKDYMRTFNAYMSFGKSGDKI